MSDQKQLQFGHTEKALAVDRPTGEIAHNALLAAAAAILNQTGKLRQQRPENSALTLQPHLIELIERFMLDGQKQDYSAPILLASRYFLCATLDELIIHSSWITNNAWDKKTLLDHFKQEPRQSGHFFLILQRTCENPQEHIDLIELGFHCLSTGFMGEYKTKNNGAEVISTLMEELHQIIIDIRGEPPKQLFLKSPTAAPIKRKRIGWSARPLWAGLAWGACVAVFLVVLLPYKNKLNHLANPIQQELITLNQK
jgi:type VI secretion system protein ImpK